MNFQHTVCKPALAWFAKSLKNGADLGTRTLDPLITKPVASLKTKGFSVNRRFRRPQKTATLPFIVNRDMATPGTPGHG